MAIDPKTWQFFHQGQLGVGRNEDTATPKVVEIHNVVSVAAGEESMSM